MANCEEPSSLECIFKSELFPLKKLVSDDDNLQVPFPLLCGESVEYLGRTKDGIIAISNYRLLVRFKESFVNIPLQLIENVESKDIFHINVWCKDATVIRCSFPANDIAQDWFKRLSAKIVSPKQLNELFAFAFYAWCMDKSFCPVEHDACYQLCQPDGRFQYTFGSEVMRMKFDTKTAWKISYVNEDFKLCPSYPKLHIVPNSINDKALSSVARFRAVRRFPSVVWRNQCNGAVIARCSQPELGWLGWRNEDDEDFVKALSEACALNVGTDVNKKILRTPSDDCGENQFMFQREDSAQQLNSQNEAQKLMILDCRSYSAAFANRAKGGGCERPEYYPTCEIQFMNLPNIHSVRSSFIALRLLCSYGKDQSNWLSGLENTKWLQNIGALLRTACIVLNANHRERRPVLVHCSDGWDRTPQVVALAELLLDPYYRTIEGFQVLVEKEWLEFGHKFTDRCGNGVNSDDLNERSPVFLQWLDCVYQLTRQFPCAFEFNEIYLVKLVQHTYSCLFGTFLCNTAEERLKENIFKKTASVWSLLQTNRKFQNLLYNPEQEVLYPSYSIHNLSLWTSIYLSKKLSSTFIDDGIIPSETDKPEEIEPERLQKTRSCENLVSALETQIDTTTTNRRMSDPNLNLEMHEHATMFLKEVNAEAAVNKNEHNGDTDNSTCEYLDKETSTTPYNRNDDTPTENCSDPSDEVKLLCGENADELTNNIKNLAINGVETDKELHVNGILENGIEENDESVENYDAKRSDSDSTVVNGCESKISLRSLNNSTSTLIDSDQNGSKESPVESDSLLDSKQIPNGLLNGVSDCNNILLKNDPVIIAKKLQALEQCTSISTSTSDISNSHVNFDFNDCSSFRIEKFLNQQGNGLKLNCNNSKAPQSNSSQSTSQHPTPSSRTPNSTCPPTPGTESKSSDGHSQRQLSSISKYLDTDGLTAFSDPMLERMQQIELEYQQKIESLESQLLTAKSLLLQYSSGACNGAGRSPFDCRDEIASLPDSADGNDFHSLGIESPASNISWETLDTKDSRMTLWVPDHAVTHCAGCESSFWLMRRRHHCRFCGKIFCGECANYYIPIPQQQLCEPARVCYFCYKQHSQNLKIPTENGYHEIEREIVPAVSS